MALSGAYPLGLTLERSRLGIAMIAGLVRNRATRLLKTFGDPTTKTRPG